MAANRQERADQRTLHASAARFVEALACRGLLCLVFEDIHWADDALLDLVEMVRILADLPDEVMRRRFDSAELVQTVVRLTG